MSGIGFSYRKYIAVIALQIVLVMTVLDVTLVNVALPVLAGEFHISNSSAACMVGITVGVFYLRRQFGHEQPLLPVDLFKKNYICEFSNNKRKNIWILKTYVN